MQDVADASDGSADADSISDATSIEIAPACPGGAGCSCDNNADCAGSLCIDTADGKQCAHVCVDSCPTGFNCKAIQSGGTDLMTVCVPKFAHLCDPCATSNDCASLGQTGGLCVDQGALGRYCGTPCTSAKDCPAGYGCQSAKAAEGGGSMQCVPLASDSTSTGSCACSASAVAKKLSTTCTVQHVDDGGKVVGLCPGTRACTATGLSACIASDIAPETCNGKDDDCDGLTDEEACNDQGACNPGTCDAKAGCKYQKLSGTPCDADGNLCTEGDTCTLGVCQPGKVVDCGDKNPCTTDSCDLAKGCTHTAFDGKSCDDDNPCTISDVCAGSVCTPGPVKPCEVTQACVVGACSVVSGKCEFSMAGDGTLCDDGNPCTVVDACASGKCSGSGSKDCDDGDGCTTDVCAAPAGCTHTANQASCDDGNACTVGDTCGLPGDGTATCQPGQAKTCDDGNPCTADSCDPKQGCVATPKAGVTVACYTGVPGTAGVGMCKSGKQTCNADGTLGACDGQVTPAASEQCDGKDDNCNGQTDETCAPKSWNYAVVPVRVLGKQVDGQAGTGLVGQASGKVNIDWSLWKWLIGWGKKP